MLHTGVPELSTEPEIVLREQETSAAVEGKHSQNSRSALCHPSIAYPKPPITANLNLLSEIEVPETAPQTHNQGQLENSKFDAVLPSLSVNSGSKPDTPLALFVSKLDNPRGMFSEFSSTLKILKQIPDVLRSPDKWAIAKARLIPKLRNPRWHPYSRSDNVISDPNVSQFPFKDIEVQVCHLPSGLPTICLEDIELMQSATILVDELPSGQSTLHCSGDIKSATLDKPELTPLEGLEIDTGSGASKECDPGYMSVCQDRQDLVANCQLSPKNTTPSAGKRIRDVACQSLTQQPGLIGRQDPSGIYAVDVSSEDPNTPIDKLYATGQQVRHLGIYCKVSVILINYPM